MDFIPIALVAIMLICGLGQCHEEDQKTYRYTVCMREAKDPENCKEK